MKLPPIMEDTTSQQHSWYIKPKDISQWTQVMGKQKECRLLRKKKGTRRGGQKMGSGGACMAQGRQANTQSHICAKCLGETHFFVC